MVQIVTQLQEKQAVNGGNKHQPVTFGETGLLDSNSNVLAK